MSVKALRLTLQVAVIAAGLLPAAVASGVTPGKLIKDPERVDAVTTSAAARAQAEVQIRRIKSLLVSKATVVPVTVREEDAAYDRLEKLQKQLRGQN